MDCQSKMGSKHRELQRKQEKRKHLAQICHADWITNFFNIQLPAVSNIQTNCAVLMAAITSLNFHFCSRRQRSTLHQEAMFFCTDCLDTIFGHATQAGRQASLATKPTCRLFAGWVLAILYLTYEAVLEFCECNQTPQLARQIRWTIKVCSEMWTYCVCKVKDQSVVTSLKGQEDQSFQWYWNIRRLDFILRFHLIWAGVFPATFLRMEAMAESRHTPAMSSPE